MMTGSRPRSQSDGTNGWTSLLITWHHAMQKYHVGNKLKHLMFSNKGCLVIWSLWPNRDMGDWCSGGLWPMMQARQCTASQEPGPWEEEHQSASVMTQMWAGYVAQRQHHLWEPYHPWETITLCHNWKGTAPENALISDRIITTKVWEGIKVKMKIKWAEMIEHFEFIYLILYTW